MNTKRLTTDSMLIAIYSVLSILTPINIVNFKFTFEAFPILVASLLLGPIDGLIVGGVGSCLYQIVFSGYGITATTLLWILPHAISGIVVGIYSKIHRFDLTFKQIVFISIVSSILVTSLNSIALYIDSKIYRYYSFSLVFGSILIKVLSGIVLAIIYSAVLPKLLIFLKTKVNKEINYED